MESGIYRKKKQAKKEKRKSHILIDSLSDAQERLKTLLSTEREFGDKPYKCICYKAPGAKF